MVTMRDPSTFFVSCDSRQVPPGSVVPNVRTLHLQAAEERGGHVGARPAAAQRPKAPWHPISP